MPRMSCESHLPVLLWHQRSRTSPLIANTCPGTYVSSLSNRFCRGRLCKAVAGSTGTAADVFDEHLEEYA